MPARLDLTGMTFGRLAAVRFVRSVPPGRSAWLFRCDCGREVEATAASVRFGNTKSCGCLVRDTSPFTRRKHGASSEGRKTVEYKAWLAMRQRCSNPKDGRFSRYGGRGISLCQAWTDSFEAFISDMGIKPDRKMSIERKDNDGNYEPSNCYWGTTKQQSRNRSITKFVVVGHERMALGDACERFGVPYRKAARLLRHGHSEQEVFSLCGS